MFRNRQPRSREGHEDNELRVDQRISSRSMHARSNYSPLCRTHTVVLCKSSRHYAVRRHGEGTRVRVPMGMVAWVLHPSFSDRWVLYTLSRVPTRFTHFMAHVILCRCG